jgi:hypothetical protein
VFFNACPLEINFQCDSTLGLRVRSTLAALFFNPCPLEMIFPCHSTLGGSF